MYICWPPHCNRAMTRGICLPATYKCHYGAQISGYVKTIFRYEGKEKRICKKSIFVNKSCLLKTTQFASNKKGTNSGTM